MSFIQKFRGITLFILLGALSTVISGFVFGASQQIYRTDANDPQVAISEIVGDLVSRGAPADAIIGQGGEVDMAKSLDSFVSIYDKEGKLLASSGKLNGNTPTVPNESFDFARKHNQNRFTWQPEKGSRFAAVLRKVDSDKGFVLVGRSLREVEHRERNLMVMTIVAWFIMLVISALLSRVLSKMAGGITLFEETNVVNVGDGEVASKIEELEEKLAEAEDKPPVV